MLTCRVCQQQKLSIEFHRSKGNPSGFQSYCKACSAVRVKAWNAANPEKNALTKRRLYVKDPARPIYASIKARCKVSGIPFDITVDDVRNLLATTVVCPVLGIKLAHRNTGKREGPADHSPSIDRRIPALGYVDGNLRVISQRANRIKDNATLNELRRLVEWLEQEDQ